MSAQTSSTPPAHDAAIEREFCDYLSEHQDFLLRHPQVLRQLEVPHASGQAVSLVERQVGALRERNVELRHRLRELTEAARENETLYTHTRALVLALLDAKSTDALRATFNTGMREHFGIDHAALILLTETGPGADGRSGSPADATADSASGPGAGASADEAGDTADIAEKPVPERATTDAMRAHEQLGALLRGTRPVCGALRPEEFNFLFGVQVACSGVIICLRDGERELGLLAVGSTDPARYHSQMGTLFIEHLAEVILRLLRHPGAAGHPAA
jgi:uncharacterized protein YigA (DUF484 family)